MVKKEDIVKNWLPRYTGTPLEEFRPYILLTNFGNYVEMFAEKFGVEVRGKDRAMQTASAGDITSAAASGPSVCMGLSCSIRAVRLASPWVARSKFEFSVFPCRRNSFQIGRNLIARSTSAFEPV